jgi:hypothetical protein
MVRLVTASSPVADPSSVSHRLMPQPREFRDSPALALQPCYRGRDAALAFILITRLAFRNCEQ